MAARLTGPADQRIVLAILILLTLAVRWQTFGNPVIEFDEQFYRLVGNRMIHGAVPFVDIWDRKPVGLFLIYALAAAIGGAGPLTSQLVAAMLVVATAMAVHTLARRMAAGSLGALLAAIAYILWLDLLQGEGGQASVLYALPMALAGLCAFDATGTTTAGGLWRRALGSMALVGLALQIKYSVVFEGMFFGLWLLWVAWRRGMTVGTIVVLGAVMIALALLPTALAWLTYAAMGQGAAFMFANFTSVMLRLPMPFMRQWPGLVAGSAAIALLLAFVPATWGRVGAAAYARRFFGLWLLAAAVAVLALHSFSPHYFIPLLLPALPLAAPGMAKRRVAAVTLLVTALVGGQVLVRYLIWAKGDAATAQRMVAAIGPVPHGLYVFDGFPALYDLTGSRLPSRYVFPGHLASAVEARALGVDPVAELDRIMAAAPDAVVMDSPVWAMTNRAVLVRLRHELAAHYRLVARIRTGRDRYRLVYRRAPGT